MTRRALRLGVGAGAILGAAGPASAHLVSTELGPFYDGAAHPLVTVEDLLTIAALAALGAYGGPKAGRWLLVPLAVSWAVGAAIGFIAAPAGWAIPGLAASVLLGLGLLGLVKAPAPPSALAAAGVVIGVLKGLMNGAAAQAADGQWLSIIGVATGVFVLTALLVALFLSVERRGATIALRVGASWIAAIGLLMLGWELRPLLTPEA